MVYGGERGFSDFHTLQYISTYRRYFLITQCKEPTTGHKIWKEGREQLDRYLSMQHGYSQYILPVKEFHHWPNKDAADNLITAFEKLGMGAGAKGSQKAPSGGTAPTPSDGTWKDSQCKT